MLRGIWCPGCFALHPAVDNAGTAACAVIDFRLHPTDFDQVIDISAHGDGGQADVLGNLLAGVLLIGVRQKFQNMLECFGLHALGCGQIGCCNRVSGIDKQTIEILLIDRAAAQCLFPAVEVVKRLPEALIGEGFDQKIGNTQPQQRFDGL